MSDLNTLEKRKLERLFGMSSGYVMQFSNSTLQSFVVDSVGIDIYAPKYDYGSGSKANRLRSFLNQEANHVVCKLLNDLIQYGQDEGLLHDEKLIHECAAIITRLKDGGTVLELDALTSPTDERDFETISKTVKAAIDNNEPEVGIDRLHTFVVKYIRVLCQKKGIEVDRDKALHSIFGEYVKRLRTDGHIESEMTDRILKSSISTLESFNTVRNKQSLAHDNPLLSYDEALLIFNHVASSIKFLKSLEDRISKPLTQ